MVVNAYLILREDGMMKTLHPRTSGIARITHFLHSSTNSTQPTCTVHNGALAQNSKFKTVEEKSS